VLSRVGLRCLLVWVLTGAVLAPAASQLPPLRQVLTDKNGIDLREGTWWHIWEPPPGVEGDKRQSRISLPLRQPLQIPEGTTWLVCNIPVAPYDTPACLFYGTEVLIGHIAGDDQTYWNDTLIGETTGRHLAETGRPRRYEVPPEAIRLGQTNQLRIRLTPFGGSSEIESVQEPLTVAPLSTAATERRLRAYQDELGRLTREVYRLGRYRPDSLPYLEFMAQRKDVWVAIDLARDMIEKETYALLRAAFDEVETELQILRDLSEPVKRQLASIEWRRYQLDMVRIAALEGVAGETLAELKEKEWEPPAAHPESFSRWGWFFRDGLPALREVTPTYIEEPGGRRIGLILSRVLDVQVVDLNWVSKTYLVRAEVELAERKEVAEFEVVASVFYPGALILPKFEPYAEVFKPENIQKFFDMRTKYFTQMLARPPGERGSVILGWDGRENDRPTLLRFTPSHFDPLGLHISICFPGGLRPIDTRSWSQPEETPKDLSSFPVIEYLSRNFPWQCREYYRYDADSDRIRIYDVFEYYYRPKDNQFLVIAPPVLSFAKARGYPIEVEPKLLNLGIDTFYGPLQGGYAKGGVLCYSLPVPSLDERALPAVEAPEPLQRLLEESIGGWEKTEATNGVDAMYKGVAAAYDAWFQIDARRRRDIAREAQDSMKAGLQGNCWPSYVEPFSGLEVAWTYALEGPYYEAYDQEWGNGLSLYGLYKHCQYSGNWHFLIRQWENVERIWSWFVRTDDWAWMRCANARHGHGSGAGDCSLAAFSGAWAYAKMADRMGRRRPSEEGRYILARMAVPLVARFAYTPWAREQKWVAPDELVLGFHEGEGFLRAGLDGYPWNATSLISGNGIHPETIEFLLQYAGSELEWYAETFDKHYPDWADGKHAYPFETLYQGNSGYITMPQLYLRSRLGWPAERLTGALEQAKTNRAMWWVAPPALGELIGGRSGVVLTRWEPATLREARLEGAQLRLALDNPVGRRLTLGLRMEQKPQACQVNDRLHSVWQYNEESKELVLRQLPNGELNIQVEWESPPASAQASEGEQP